MKLFLALLLVASCQAYQVFELIDDEAVDTPLQNVFVDIAAYDVEYGTLERFDIWGDLNDTLHRIVGHLTGKFSDLKDFFHKTIKVGAEKLHPHLINIKQLAKDVLNNVGVVSSKIAAQALEFFKPFRAQLGDLWFKLVKKIDARFHGIPEIKAAEETYLADVFVDINSYEADFRSLVTFDIWGDLNDTLHRIVGHLTGKFADLKDFFQKSIKVGAEKLQPHLINIKQLATDLLNNLGVVSEHVAAQALEFFAPFQKQLGELWVKLVAKIHERFHDLANPKDEAVADTYMVTFDIWGDLNDTLHRIVGHLSGKFADLKDFLQKSAKVGAEKLQPHLVNIHKIAKDLLNNIGVISKNVAAQALEFLAPYRKQLGDLWVQIVKKIDARFHGIPEPKDIDADDINKYMDLFINIAAYQVKYGSLERFDIWGDLNDTLHKIVGHLTGKFADLKDFFEKSIKVGAEKLQPHLINVKQLATDLLNNVGVVSEHVAAQALEFFAPFQKQLGELWVKLVEKIHERFHDLANPKDVVAVDQYLVAFDIWGDLNDTLHKIVGHLSGKFADLKDFFQKSVKVGAEKLQPHLINIQKLAKDLLNNVGLISGNVAAQALEFFAPFQKQLGDLWVQLVKAIDARFHGIPEPKDTADMYFGELFVDYTGYQVGSLERFDIWGDLNDTLHRIVGHLTGKFADLKDFFQKSIKVGAEKLQPHLINIKELAQDLLNNISVVSKQVAEQAIIFFKPFHKQLGDLWDQLVEQIYRRFHGLDIPESY